MSAPSPAAAASDPHVRLAGLGKAYGETVAVADFSLDIPRGSFTTLLGPSGCGKTTVLRMVAGFVEPDAGTVSIGGVDQAGRPPNLRGVGMVFQDYALFPHMSVLQNVEYGLRMHRVPKAERRARANRTLEQLDLTGLAERYPHQLSGGQQQRVALGRVMALEPEVLLMDEPLSNLDAKLRLRLRAELRELQRQLGITTLYVTHDQDEALSLSDQLIVMNEGRIQQAALPQRVYAAPANRFVAEFVGLANLLAATVREVGDTSMEVVAAGQSLTVRLPDERRPAAGATGTVMVRPEHVVLSPAGAPIPPDAWRASAVIASHGFFGSFERYWLDVEGASEQWLVDVPLTSADANGWAQLASAPASHPGEKQGVLAVGTEVSLSLRPGTASWLW